jgi:hypothetical protein
LSLFGVSPDLPLLVLPGAAFSRKSAAMQYLVLSFNTGEQAGLKDLQALLNAKAAEGYELVQVVYRSTYVREVYLKRVAVEGA